MKPIPEDTTSDFSDDHTLHGTEPTLYPIYPTADSIPERNELVYAFPDSQFKVVVGPVKQDNRGVVWRVELHPDAMDDSQPQKFPTFNAAFEQASEYADDRLSPTNDA